MSDRRNKQMPLLSKYLEAFEKDPKSRVFAPLAESYRKLGMHKEAFEVLKKGLSVHPKYTMARTVLANCYYDKELYSDVIKTLAPLVEDHSDNILMQRLYAHALLKIGKEKEALEVYKYLLFLDPKDKELGELVKNLEWRSEPLPNMKDSVLEKELEGHRPEINEDEWVQVDLAAAPSAEEVFGDEEDELKPRVLKEEPKIEEKRPANIDDFEESPLFTHTLVDLYIGQKLYLKAIDVLEKILELNPDDTSTQKKLIEVQKLVGENKTFEKQTSEGHQDLMKAYDLRFSGKVEKTQVEKVERVLKNFLSNIKERRV